jgi:Na+/H+ antiporter NhaA
MASRFWELIALSLLAGIGFRLALVRGDLIFVAVFGAASTVADYRSDTTFAVR